ncbi:MAG: hypothetical protein A2297_01745 [Elusimicrobia bacterium RIFOXYB2_FULL_48_7]|nr:MAG: hypothetical protein A2297_01745 [Elusimicrobia bacterium RIFOXYB2_FULL_48_7]
MDNYRKIEKPAPANLELRIAQCYYNAKDSTSAVQSLKELVEKHPRAPEAKEAMELLCNLVDSPGSGESALSAIDDLRYILGKNNPLIVSARFKAAKKFFEGKNYARAIETLEELSSELANSGKFADANFFLAESYYQLGRLDESILTFKRFTENFPQDKRAVVSLFRMGSAQFKQNRFEDSVKTFEKLTAGHPECEYCPAALYNTALSYKKLENWDRVAATLKTYMEKYPSEAESSGASFELAAVYEEQKQYAQANKTLEAIRDKTLQCSGIWGETTFRIAENHMAAGNETLAMDEYSKLTVIEINPALETWALNAMARAGEYYERKNDDYKALSYYERICERTKGLAEKPSWLDAVKARIDVIKSKVVMQ